MSQEIKRLFNSKNNLAWKKFYNREHIDEENWIPIINIFDDEVWIGISELGYWVLENERHTIIRLCHGCDLRALLPCLQRPYTEVIQKIEKALIERNIPREILDDLPITDLILLALKIKSDFWASKALEWLEYVHPNEEILFQLQQVNKEKWLTQKTRHQVRKLIKKIEISGSDI